MSERLTHLEAGMPILFGGDRVARVPTDLAARFMAGDRLLVVQETGDLLHVPAEQQRIAAAAVDRAREAFVVMGEVPDARISAFFAEFAARLEDGATWSAIAAANAGDVERARARGRSTTRLVATDRMRADMAAGLRAWQSAPPGRGRVVERLDHEGWAVEQVTAPLGVVAFVFEGRPNVFADAAGVLRGGNTVVFRIGSDALETARAIVRNALDPALEAAGLPAGAATLVESAERAAGWAMFSDRRVGLAVARGSGRAVAQLGSVARQAGIPVSLHGMGGAWLVADVDADAHRFEAAVYRSLDRKVCNTLNVCCVAAPRAAELVPRFLAALRRAGDLRGHGCKLHVVAGSEGWIPEDWRAAVTQVRRAGGDREEPLVEVIPIAELGREWEWEETPELTLVVVESAVEAATLFNQYSPQFIAALISEDRANQSAFFQRVNAPFTGDGFTRWVDGQYAFCRPELGLSNWEGGRLLARGGVLAGDSVYTLRTRVTQHDPDLHR